MAPAPVQRPSVAWVTGSAGLIGSHVVGLQPAGTAGWKVVALTRPSLDLGDFESVERAFRRDQPRLVIHCAALSRAAGCQENPSLARRVNTEATAFLAGLASGIPFVFLSTDLVFDGRRGNYAETDPVNPLSLYGETKAAAEQAVLANPRHTVLRLSLIYGRSPSGDRSFNEEMHRAWAAGQTLRLFTDEYRSPLAVPVAARCIWELALLDKPGLYHLAGAERLSRWDIGVLLASHWPHLVCRMEPASFRDYAGPPRAPDTSLNCAKIQRLLPAPLPRFSDWLRSPVPS